MALLLHGSERSWNRSVFLVYSIAQFFTHSECSITIIYKDFNSGGPFKIIPISSGHVPGLTLEILESSIPFLCNDRQVLSMAKSSRFLPYSFLLPKFYFLTRHLFWEISNLKGNPVWHRDNTFLGTSDHLGSSSRSTSAGMGRWESRHRTCLSENHTSAFSLSS